MHVGESGWEGRGKGCRVEKGQDQHGEGGAKGRRGEGGPAAAAPGANIGPPAADVLRLETEPAAEHAAAAGIEEKAGAEAGLEGLREKATRQPGVSGVLRSVFPRK